MSELRPNHWPLEYELRQLIDVAMRWQIDAVYSTVTISRPYSSVLSNVVDLRQQFELFSSQLTERLGTINNWKAIEIDLNIRFLRGIDSYLMWYESNVEKTRRFEPHNPYETIHIICKRTKDIILSHFGKNPQTQVLHDPSFKDEKTAELFEYIIDNWKYDKQQKWAEIFHVINETEKYKILYSGDYEKYIRQRFEYLGKFQYEKSRDKNRDNRDRQNLMNIIKEFSRK